MKQIDSYVLPFIQVIFSECLCIFCCYADPHDLWWNHTLKLYGVISGRKISSKIKRELKFLKNTSI